MTGIFSKITNLVIKRPVKVLFITVLALVLMIVGVAQIKLATGNETLVQIDTEAYLSNLGMENTFGSDSIIVLFTAEDQEALLNLNNIRSMWTVHQALHHEENIFSLMSPASVVNQIAVMQVNELKVRVGDISAGLYEISEMMTGLSTELSSKEIKDPREIEKKLGELSQATSVFGQLIEVQNNLSAGTVQLQLGMGEVATGLGQVSGQLHALADSADNPQLAQQLVVIAEKIEASSLGLADMSVKTGQFSIGNEQTAKALTEMEKKISSEVAGMQSGLSGGISPDQLTDMVSGFTIVGENLHTIADALTMFYAKSGMMIADIPDRQQELDEIIFAEDGEMRALFANVIPDDNNALMVVKLEGNLGDTDKDQIYEKLDRLLERQEFESLSYVVSGRPVLDTSLRAEMQSNMKSMVAFAVVIMIVILLLIFKVRWRILPLITVFIAVLATLGLMGSVGIPMTMVSMAVFPILIGLGIDYSIQFQNRYEEERSLKATLSQMGPAIGTAVFATVLGFIALLISPVPMIQDFGKMLTIGVIVSYLAGIFFLLPTLYIRDRFFLTDTQAAKNQPRKSSLLETKLKKFTTVLLRHSVIILVIAVTLAAWGIWADGKVGVQTDIETFMPQDTPALADLHQLRDVLESTDQLVLFLEADNVLSPENLAWITQKTEILPMQFPNIIVDVKSISSLVEAMAENPSHEQALKTIENIPDAQRKVFLSPANDKTIITLSLRHVPIEEVQSFILDLEQIIQDTDMQVGITGKSALDVEMINGLTSGRTKMTFLGLSLVFLGLLVIYRNFFKAMIPVFPISLIVGLSGGIMQILGLKYTPLTATLGALILGIGTEMTILLLERYIEERKNGLNKLQAMETAVGKIGVAIIASGVTTIGGFGVLMISKFVILKDFGLMTVINMSLALFATLVVLPPLIYLLDRWIVNPKLNKQEQVS